LFLDHNFLTGNARKLFKGSKDSDSSLVSNQNYSEIFPSNGWALDQVTWAKMTIKLPRLWCHSQKTWNPKPKFFFHCRLEDLPSLLKVRTALQHNWPKSYAVARTHENCLISDWFQSTIYSYTGSQRVNYVLAYIGRTWKSTDGSNHNCAAAIGKPSSKCAKLHTVTASNNRDHTLWSFSASTSCHI